MILTALYSQQKGATPLIEHHSPRITSSKTYAVVVGISDYQDPEIPDLKYVHKDAEAFANFLRSPGGGGLDADHLKVLINNQATAGQISSALYWLVEETKENDKVIIYFSGHGDVERKFMGQPGFLLCWDAPSKVYMAGGVLEIGMLQTIISTLSLENKAHVTLITDACHSGKLSGSPINGSQLTNANLAKQYANEIKILSCQPNEYSIEGEQWGGGRGAFSYYLVDGLYGMADANKDQTVDLFEIGRYLEDYVAKEVAPEGQFPITIGNRNEMVATVIPEVLAQIQKSKSDKFPTFQASESKGIEEMVLSEVDTSIQDLYRLFKMALKDKIFLEPVNACADYYYEKLLLEPKLKRLHSTMKRNYAASLQDDSQQMINKWMKTDLTEILLDPRIQFEKYKSYPSYLERACSLLGRQHYMYPNLQARKHFFEGYLLILSDRNDNEMGEKALTKFRQALEWQPELPYVYLLMARVLTTNFNQQDSAVYYTLRASELASYWVLPFAYISILHSNKKNQLEHAKLYLERANLIDSNSAIIMLAWGFFYLVQDKYHEAELKFKNTIKIDSTISITYWFLGELYKYTKNYQEAEVQCRKAIKLDSTQNSYYILLGDIYKSTGRYIEAELICKKSMQIDSSQNQSYMLMILGSIYLETDRYKEVETVSKKALQLDSTILWPYDFLSWAYMNLDRFPEAEQVCKKALKLDSTHINAYNNLVRVYISTRRYEEAEQLCKKAIQLDSTHVNTYNNLASVYIKNSRYVEAEQICNKVIQLDSTDVNAHINLAKVYINTRGYAEAEKIFIKLILLDTTNQSAYYDFACFLSLQKMVDKAFEYIELSIKKGNSSFDWMQKDTDLKLLREQKERWNALMKKYFPEKFNDVIQSKIPQSEEK